MKNKDRFKTQDCAFRAWMNECWKNTGDGTIVKVEFGKWLFEEYDEKKSETSSATDRFYTEHGTSISAVRAKDENRTVVFKIDRVRHFGNWEAEVAFGRECARLIDSICEYLNRSGRFATEHSVITMNEYLENKCARLERERDTVLKERNKALEELNELRNRGITCSGSYVKLEYHEEVKKERDMLRSENESMSRNLAVLHDVDDKLAKSERDCTAWKNQAQASQKKLTDTVKELDGAKRAYDELKRDMLVTEAELKRFKDMELSLATKENYEREIRILEQQRRDKDAKIVELGDDLKIVKSERNKLRLMLDEQTGTLAGARGNAELFERERNAARAKLEEVEKQLEQMRKGRDARQKERDEEREKNRKLRERISQLEAACEGSIKDINSSIPKVVEQTKELNELRMKVSQIKLLVES